MASRQNPENKGQRQESTWGVAGAEEPSLAGMRSASEADQKGEAGVVPPWRGLF